MDGREEEKVSEIDNTRCFKTGFASSCLRERFETFNSIVASCFRTGDVEFNLSTVLETIISSKYSRETRVKGKKGGR